MAQRVRASRKPANGDVWRSCRARSPGPQETGYLAGRPGEDLAPRIGAWLRHGPIANPVLDPAPRPLDERWFGPEAFRDRVVELEARVLGDRVASVGHWGSLAEVAQSTGSTRLARRVVAWEEARGDAQVESEEDLPG